SHTLASVESVGATMSFSLAPSIVPHQIVAGFPLFARGVQHLLAALRRPKMPPREREAESLGFAAAPLEACPFHCPDLVAAFARGRCEREQWDAASW
ncbi:MAG TPA: hypothetical protein VN579_05865, partial [Bryobacteraceae bacterium]|nr:hypothetical protein [Bryobacteraceae bacterium]